MLEKSLSVTPCTIPSVPYRVASTCPTVHTGSAVDPTPGDAFIGAANTASLEMATQRVQSIWRGQRSRKNIHIRTVAKGLIFVRISGDERFFDRIGLHGGTSGHIAAKKSSPGRSHRKERHIAYLAVDHRHFAGCLLADSHRLRHPRDFHHPPEQQLDASSDGSFSSLPQHATRPMAYINGGFFNFHQWASTTAEAHASIGQSGLRDVLLPSLPLPHDYRRDYRQIVFEDGSLLHTGPRLSLAGMPVFTQKLGTNPKYDVVAGFCSGIDRITPGHLRHAAGKHPRAAISSPTAPGRGVMADAHEGWHQGWTRLAVGTMKQHGASVTAGYTLAEWAKITARLDRLASPPNASINLDGGRSVALGVAGLGDGDIRVAQCDKGRSVANFIGFVERTPGG